MATVTRKLCTNYRSKDFGPVLRPMSNRLRRRSVFTKTFLFWTEHVQMLALCCTLLSPTGQRERLRTLNNKPACKYYFLFLFLLNPTEQHGYPTRPTVCMTGFTTVCKISFMTFEPHNHGDPTSAYVFLELELTLDKLSHAHDYMHTR